MTNFANDFSNCKILSITEIQNICPKPCTWDQSEIMIFNFSDLMLACRVEGQMGAWVPLSFWSSAHPFTVSCSHPEESISFPTFTWSTLTLHSMFLFHL